METLRGMHIFHGLSERQLVRIAQRVRSHSRPAKTVVWSEGDPVAKVFLLTEGEWVMTRTFVDKEVLKQIVPICRHPGLAHLYNRLAGENKMANKAKQSYAESNQAKQSQTELNRPKQKRSRVKPRETKPNRAKQTQTKAKQ
eukprot:2720033-Pyramimonas_sp.AAC.1